MTPLTLAVVSVTGGFGAACRFVLDGAIRDRWPRELPIGTLVVNVTGSFLIGLLAALLLATGPVAHPAYLVGATGFCGGFTTFSTAMVEGVRLARNGDWRRAAAYTLGSLLLTLAAACLGVLLGQSLTG